MSAALKEQTRRSNRCARSSVCSLIHKLAIWSRLEDSSGILKGVLSFRGSGWWKRWSRRPSSHDVASDQGKRCHSFALYWQDVATLVAYALIYVD